MFSTISYDIKPIQQEAVWDGVIQKDSMWCFPKEWDAKKALKSLVKNYDGASGKAKKLQKYLKKKFSEQNQNQKQAEFIMGEPLKAIEVEDLPKISIITSVYDGDDFIEPFLEDITSQTIFKDKCELVLVNAYSPGSEDSVIQKYGKKYPDNIIYEKLEEDPGLYGTWNHALKLSTGEFVTNANLDDRKKLNSIEEHARALVADPQVGLVYADSYITHKPNETFEEFKSKKILI